MKYLSYFLSGLIAVLPMLWIEDYTLTNPVWWTVFSAWNLGRIWTLIEVFFDKEN